MDHMNSFTVGLPYIQSIQLSHNDVVNASSRYRLTNKIPIMTMATNLDETAKNVV
jgi:hypothetical protein